MRSFRKSAARSPLSVLCVMLLVMPIFGMAFATLPAMAQTGAIEAAVVDFRNLSRIPNEMFATMATDAVVVELIRSGKFSVTTADALQTSMEELGYKDKGDRSAKVILTPSMMMRVGDEVGADCIVSGEITEIVVDKEKRRAEVRLITRILHVASGEWENGAVVRGVSNPRIGYSADQESDLIIEAINNAARQAVDGMVRYIIPEATVIGTFGTNEILLNKGSQEGIYVGMEMIALRRGGGGEDDVVGRLKITRVSDTDSRAVVTKSMRGLRPEDRVRAVFTLPLDTGVQAESARVDQRHKVERGTKYLLGLAALVGIAALFKGGQARQELPTAVVMAGKSPDVVTGFGEGGNLLAWNNPKHVAYRDIIEFHVWRDNHSNYGGTGGSDATNVGPVMANDMKTAIQYSGFIGKYDHFAIDDIGGRSFGYRSENPTDKTSMSDSSQDTFGIRTGTPHRYWVSFLFARRTSNIEGEEIATYWESDPIYAGRATYLTRPEPREPGGFITNDYQDLSDITFSWYGSGGADQYVIEVSTSPDFVRNQTWVDTIYQPTSADKTPFTKTYKNVLKNVTTGKVVTELANVPPGGTVFWRIGARNRLDTPGPYPAGPTPQLDGPKTTRYIYSDPMQVYSFMTLPDMPGPPPFDPGGPGDNDTPLPPPPPPM